MTLMELHIKTVRLNDVKDMDSYPALHFNYLTLIIWKHLCHTPFFFYGGI
jgi:hypothetical protein